MVGRTVTWSAWSKEDEATGGRALEVAAPREEFEANDSEAAWGSRNMAEEASGWTPSAPLLARVGSRGEDINKESSREGGEASGGETASWGATWSEGSDDLPIGAAASTSPSHLAAGRTAALWPGVGHERKLPPQWQARRFYKYMLPLALVQLVVMVVPILGLFNHEGQKFGAQLVLFLSNIPPWLSWMVFGMYSLTTVVNYVYHYFRLAGSEAVPVQPGFETSSRPLQHVVIVCAYKEPAEVLERTFESIAQQRGIDRAPIAVLAAEDRDESRHACFAALQQRCGGRLSRLLLTSHSLSEGEATGKSSNENFAAREVYRRLVDSEGYDPFEVIVTICDADSIFSHTYLSHVEAAYTGEPDGRRLIYKGPLNVYRNFSDAGLLVQSLELARCHQDAFHSLMTVPYPYSNYSLSLGFASELGFWTPDCMPEDIHTANKAMVNSFGSRAVVTIPSVICNDLVPLVADRYEQAKRHQFGSVTELAWLGALLTETRLRLPAWGAVLCAEASRAGSLPGAMLCLAGHLLNAALVVALHQNWQDLTPSATTALSLMGASAVVQWTCFWAAELALWATLLQQFPLQRPSFVRWLLLIAVMPFASLVNSLLFFIVPTLHALYHAAFVGELAYVCAPKGEAARGLAPGLDKLSPRGTRSSSPSSGVSGL